MGKTRRGDSDIDESQKPTFNRHYDHRARYIQADEASDEQDEKATQKSQAGRYPEA